MQNIGSKSQLAIILSRLKGFESPKVKKEQYMTDSEVAASVLWNAYLLGDIEGRVVLDLGCGTGILGIGSLLLGAKQAIFVDSDLDAIKKGVKNNIQLVESEGYKLGKAKLMHKPVEEAQEVQAEVVVQNPPFGTKNKGMDVIFVGKALETAPIVYSLHKSETKAYLEAFAAKKNAKITHIWDFKYPLKATMQFHRRRMHCINVSCMRFEKISDEKDEK